MSGGMRRRLLTRLIAGAGAILVWPMAAGAAGAVQDVTFPTNVVPRTTNAAAVTLKARLHLPEAPQGPIAAVIITPSSGGVQAEREVFYAEELAKAGIAALVIDSFGARGVASTLYDQRTVTAFQTANDAMAGLAFLARDPRFLADRIGITGVSKGGIAALNTGLSIQRRWMSASDGLKFAAHAPIAPACTWINRSLATTGAPILFLLAELDDQTPAAPCIAMAARLKAAGNPKVEVRMFKGAHHAWERLGEMPISDPRAENYAKCRVTVEDDGRMIASDGSTVPRDDWHGWAKRTCMTLGTRCCGGNAELKRQATAALIGFFKRQGF